MLWYLVFGVIAALLAISLAIPTTRRVWAFDLYGVKQVLIWLASALGLRRLWAWLRRRPYTPYTRPQSMRHFCEDMGPTYIKFGQIVASSAGMFPERYSVEFHKCLDAVRPFPFEQVTEIIAAELGAETARRLSEIEPVPLASASIAQVHTARLDNSVDVVIKVQRPNIESRMEADVKLMRQVAIVAEKLVRNAEISNPVGIVDDLATTLREELDFTKEAKNLDLFNQIMRELGHSDVRAPMPYWDLTTKRVLVMERFVGTRVDDVDEITRREIDAEDRLVHGMRAWFQCVLFYGFFHGDVHAGNLMLLANDDLGFLDFGIVGRFDARQRALVTDYIVAFTTRDYRGLADAIIDMGGLDDPDGIDMDAVVADLEKTYSPLLTKSFGEINLASMIPDIHRVAARHHMRMPREFILITKQMLYFDRYAKLLAPSLNVFTDPRLVASLLVDIQKARAQSDAAKSS